MATGGEQCALVKCKIRHVFQNTSSCCYRDVAFDAWLETGHYASRLLGELHGPFKTDSGCVLLEISFPDTIQK